MYTIIGYKENNSDYCRGCLMDSWSSNLVIEKADNWEDAIQKAVEIKNIARDEYENEHELTVIDWNGKLIIENGQPSDSDEYDDGRNFLDEVSEAVKQSRLTELERKQAAKQAAILEQQKLELQRVAQVEAERIQKEITERDRLLALYPLEK